MKRLTRNSLVISLQRAATASLTGLAFGMLAGTAAAVPLTLNSTIAADSTFDAPQPSLAQMKTLDTRLAMVHEIWQAANRTPAIATLSESEKRSRLISLYSAPSATLSTLVGKGFNSAAEFDDAVSLALSASAEGGVRSNAKSLGSNTQDWTFRAFTPCRMYDSRFSANQATSAFGSGTILPANVWHNVNTNGTGRGAAAGCSVYTKAGVDTLNTPTLAFGAVAVSMGTVDATTALTATMRPWGGSSGGPSSVIIAAPTTAPVTASAIVAIAQDNEATLQLQLFNTTGSAHVSIDVFGAFVITPATALQCLDTADTVVVVPAGSTSNSNAPVCTAGYTQTSTSCESSSWDMPMVFQSGGTCSARNNGAASANLRASRTCCRTPGR
jgi:hypothetical protein